MNAVLLSVGDELLSGAVLDTNSAWLSRRLLERGLSVVRHVTVGDREEAIAGAISAAGEEAEVVIVTGGLGPTADDLSRQGLATAMNVPLREDARCLGWITGYFASISRPMTPSNRLQALLPEGGEPMRNACGTAPGIAARVGKAAVFCLPGPPHEMMDMFDRQVLPRLPAAGCIATRALHTFGLGESAVGEKIADLMVRGREPAVGTTASSGVISVRISAKAATPQEASARAGQTAQEVRARLGEVVFGQDDQTLASVVGEALAQAGQTLALAESCTGGMLGEMVTSVSGSSRYFLGGVVAYANSVKADLLGVGADLLAEHGAVSEAAARAMAVGAKARFGSDWGLAVTGIAGPGGGSPARPVGLVCIGLAWPGGSSVHRYVFPGQRDFIRRRSAMAALNHLRLALRGGAGG
jgi:nicotinamide-nucleotide amidase